MSSMNQIGLSTLNQTLAALDRVLGKLAAHCEAKKIDEAIFVSARLFPDMFALARQVQIACDFAKGAAARLSGAEVPAWADDEKSIAELRARIAKTRNYVDGIPASAYAGSDDRVIKIKLGRNAPETEMAGKDYLAKVVLPNFYFHAAMAYAILRNGGVELGKNDFLDR
ncbi:MAG: DUF1993 domain-containing protein [Proteobacteria bacterium]|nr:DUF1993 domain-containing protein [Pseudomonadota bacterium]